MIFYDVDLLDDRPKPLPLSDEEYAQRCETYNLLLADYKQRTSKAFGPRQARRLENEVAEFKDRNAMLDLSFHDWSSMLEALLMAGCCAFLEAKIKYTPKKYQHEWTSEELDELIEICGIDAQGRYYIFRTAGLVCNAPECPPKHGLADVIYASVNADTNA